MQRFAPGERPRERWRSLERRRQPRFAPPLPVRAYGEVNGPLHDISRTGLCLLAEGPLPTGRVVALELFDETAGLSCRFRARIVWYRPGSPGRAGLEFVEMSPTQDAWLAARFVDWVSAVIDP